MEIKIEKAVGERGTSLVLVDDEQWGQFEMQNHGPQGNSYVLFQKGSGHNVRDIGVRQSLKVYGDKLTKRITYDRPWHRMELPLEERLQVAAKYAVEKDLLRHPDVVRAEFNVRHEEMLREQRAQEALRLEKDMGVGMLIADECFPVSESPYVDHLRKLKLAKMIADAIEKGRSE
jgi:hypothetical protein